MTPECKDCRKLGRTCDACTEHWYKVGAATRKRQRDERMAAYRRLRRRGRAR